MNQAPHQLLKTSPSMKIGLTLLSCLATTLAFNINYEDLERTAQVIPEPELEEGPETLFNPQFNFTGRYYLDTCTCTCTYPKSTLFFPSLSGDRIVGGTKVGSMTQFPWQVSLIFGFHFCGGAILDTCTILTAAHCMIYSSSKILIRAGSLKWYSGGQVRKYKTN